MKVRWWWMVLMCFVVFLSVYVWTPRGSSDAFAPSPHEIDQFEATTNAPPLTSSDCLFYSTTPKPPNINRTSLPYPSYIFNSHLIDLVYLQNSNHRLTHGEGWNRTLRLLEVCRAEGIVLFASSDAIFHEPMSYIASWLRAYGCLSVEVFRSDVDLAVVGAKAWAAIIIYIPNTAGLWGHPLPYNNLILIQTEQLTSTHWLTKLKPTLLKCLEAPSCVIWDFSEANYKHSVLHYEVLLPVVILPITLRSTLVMGSVPALGGRPYGYVFYGYRNERRKAVLGRLPPGLTAWERPQCVEAYQYAKFCISVHFYSSESGLEFHRLAQHIKAGCLPVYETPGDADIVQFFEYHKTLKFVEESEFSELLKRMDQCITEYHGIMQEQQIFIIQWWSKELESFEKVLKAFFYHYGE